MKHLGLFEGMGGFSYAAEWSGIETVAWCEIDTYCQKLLKQNFPNAKGHGDIREFDAAQYAGKIDIITGGFPCQDISIAGKGVGISGERSGLWSEMWRIIRDVGPKYVIIENSSALTFRGFEQVLCDLSKIGYDAEWQCLHGYAFGLQHGRERVYIIAYANEKRAERRGEESVFREYKIQRYNIVFPGFRTRRDIPEPRTFRSAHDIPNLSKRIGAVGNAVMPVIAYYLFQCIILDHENTKTA